MKQEISKILGKFIKKISKQGKDYFKGQILFNGVRVNLLLFYGKNKKDELFVLLDSNNPEIK